MKNMRRMEDDQLDNPDDDPGHGIF
jgi:hypothetical protein